MAQPVFQAIVSTLDKSSPALATITRNIQGMTGAAMRTNVATQRIGLGSAGPLAAMHGNVARVAGAFGTLRTRIGGVASSITSLVPGMAALAGAGSVAGVFAFVKHIADAREETLRMAKVIGIAPASLGRLNYVSQMTGTNIEAMHTSMTRLNRVMGDAAGGRNKQALALFQRIGVTMTELRSGNAASILGKLAASFQATTSTTTRAAMAAELFGRGWKEVAPLLLEAPADVRAMAGEFDRLAYKFTDIDDNNLKQFRQSWIGLETAVGGFANEVGAGLAPVLTPIVQEMRGWIAANRDWLASDIVGGVRELRDHLSQITGGADAFATAIGGWGPTAKIAAAAVVLALGPVATMIAGIVLGLDRFSSFQKPENLPPESPFWRQIPHDQQLHYPNSPASQETGRTAPSTNMFGGKPVGEAIWDWFTNAPPLPAAPLYGPPTPSGALPTLALPPPPAPGAATPGLPAAPPPGVFAPLALPALPGDRGGGIAPLQITPNLYSPSSAPGAPGQQGAVDVNVKFANAPPGTSGDVRGSGGVNAPPAQVGYAFGFERRAYG